MLRGLELSHNDEEATNNFSRVKRKGTVEHNTVTRWFKKFCSGYKNFDDQERSGRPESVDSEAMFQNHWVKSGE